MVVAGAYHSAIFGQRFYNRSAIPAWHQLGINREEDWNAERSLREVDVVYGIYKQPLMRVMPDGTQEASGLYQILREPTKDDPKWMVLGNPVTEDYEPNNPLMTAQMWDENVLDLAGNPVAIETLGLLYKGAHMFISTKLPSFDVKGDQIDNYLILDSPFEAGNAYSVNIANIRPVCQNTLRAALAGATQAKSIAHTQGAREFLAKWLRTLYGDALKTTELMQQAYTDLANTPVTIPQIKWIIDGTYPLPKEPQLEDQSRRDFAERMENYERNVALVKRIRQAAFNCTQGAGQGNDTPAAQGTAWGAWQGVTQVETYRRGDLGKTAEQLIGGERKVRMENAFRLAQNVQNWDRVEMSSIGLRRVRA